MFELEAKDIIEGRDIIVTGQQPWDTKIGSNCKNLAVEFSKLNRVLYVNSPLDRGTLWRQRNTPEVRKRLDIIQGKRPALEQINENMWTYYPDKMIESINWIPIVGIHSFMNRINNQRFASSIRRAMAALNFKNTIWFNDNDIIRCLHLKELLEPDLSIYYSRDFVVSTEYWSRHGRRLEPEIIKKADMCLTNSDYLKDYCKQYNPIVYNVGQGCDTDIFTAGIAAPVPQDIAHIPHPIIGYVGALHSVRLDIELLIKLAQKHPDWQFVFVGPEDEGFQKSDLHLLQNVHFMGSRDFDQLPAYINAFDVCINPQGVNDLTIGNYPRKIDEYLAVGKPIVATVTKGMEIFRDYSYLGHDAESYSKLIQQALDEDGPELRRKRIELAAEHTWENNVKLMYTHMLQHLPEKKA